MSLNVDSLRLRTFKDPITKKNSGYAFSRSSLLEITKPGNLTDETGIHWKEKVADSGNDHRFLDKSIYRIKPYREAIPSDVICFLRDTSSDMKFYRERVVDRITTS